jgi:FkbM family methyltransferase
MRPIVVMDIGARSGIQSFWTSSPYPIKVIGFEPDEEECRLLNNELLSSEHPKDAPTVTYYPVALGRERAKRKLYLYKDRRLSSFFLPNLSLLNHFPLDQLLMPEAFSIDAEVAVDCVPLDEFCPREEINDVDFIKIDTQGSEMEILQGGPETLRKTFAVAIEVEFAPIYEKQPLFADVDSFLRGQGFSMFDLSRFWWKRSVPPEIDSRGQMIFADAIYLRDLWNREASHYFWQALVEEPERIERAIVIASLLGFSDYGLDLLDYHLSRQYIDKHRYEAWRARYIHIRKGPKSLRTSLFARLMRRIIPNHAFWEKLTRLVERRRAQLLNERFYDSDESGSYR